MTRKRCTTCLRPDTTCLCHWVQPLLAKPIDNNLEIIIIQHPKEEFHAKGTARLLNLCLNNCRIVVTEKITDDLNQLLCDQKHDLLVFPDSESTDIETTSEVLTNLKVSKEFQHYRLWLLDGTWRKARKIYYSNAQLQSIPKFDIGAVLTQPKAGGYSIRKAEQVGQLSTFEACVEALEFLNAIPKSDIAHLQRIFDEFIHRLKKYLPS